MGIGGWRRGRIIGRGASATVSLATSDDSGELFAVKSSELARSALLQREQTILSALDSPFVVSYLGFDVAPAAPGAELLFNLFVEYAHGGSLHDEIKKQGGRLDELAIRSYTRDVVSGLAYLHANGVVHCDVKSRNVLVCSGGRAKVADLGCARRAGEEDEREGKCMRGTPVFMAPEVARAEEQGAPADVWALGCTVAEMATGGPPWLLASDPVAALHRIAFSADVPEFPSWISEDGKDFLSRCLGRDPAQRWTAEQLLQHPFVAPRSKSETNYDWVSPKSTLDQAFWESLSDSCGGGGDDDGKVLEQAAEEEPFERMQSLIGGCGAPNWTWDEKWVTVRSHGRECCSPATEEEETWTNTSSEVEFMLDVDMEHVVESSRDYSYVNDYCSFYDTSVTQLQLGEEGIERQLLTCKCNREGYNT